MALQTVNEGIMPVRLQDASGSPQTLGQSMFNGSQYGTYRGFGSDFFNAEGIAYEDFMRGEQSAINAFNRESAFEERMSNTAYQRAVADMKAAGLSPVLAYGQGGASSPNITAQAGNTGYQGARSNAMSSILGAGIQLAAGLLTRGMTSNSMLKIARENNDVKIDLQNMRNENRKDVQDMRDTAHYYRDKSWRAWYDKRSKK